MAGEGLVVEYLTSTKFYVELSIDDSDDRVDGYFMECSGLERTQDVVEHCEVTPLLWGGGTFGVPTARGKLVRTKLPGEAKSANITLKQGLTVSKSFWRWMKQVEEGDWNGKMRDGDITVYNQACEESARFRFEQAWPVKLSVSNFNASGNEMSSVEIELAVHQFYRVVDD
ncbi:MAG: phage tail protein [Leptolyngbyaceae cyanobacterium]